MVAPLGSRTSPVMSPKVCPKQERTATAKNNSRPAKERKKSLMRTPSSYDRNDLEWTAVYTKTGSAAKATIPDPWQASLYLSSQRAIARGKTGGRKQTC